MARSEDDARRDRAGAREAVQEEGGRRRDGLGWLPWALLWVAAVSLLGLLLRLLGLLIAPDAGDDPEGVATRRRAFAGAALVGGGEDDRADPPRIDEDDLGQTGLAPHAGTKTLDEVPGGIVPPGADGADDATDAGATRGAGT